MQSRGPAVLVLWCHPVCGGSGGLRVLRRSGEALAGSASEEETATGRIGATAAGGEHDSLH